MNYFDYENQFWRLDEMEGFTPVQTRIFFYLLTLFNRAYWTSSSSSWLGKVCKHPLLSLHSVGWEGEVTISDAQFSAKVGVALNSFKRAKLGLQARGVITFEQGVKGYAKKTRYQLRCEVSRPSSSQLSCQSGTPLYSNKQETKSKTILKNGRAKGFNTTAGDFD